MPEAMNAEILKDRARAKKTCAKRSASGPAHLQLREARHERPNFATNNHTTLTPSGANTASRLSCGAAMAPAADMDDGLNAETSAAFTVLKQKLELDFSFSPRRIKGKTTIEIQPQDEHLKYIQLNCRQLNITSVKIQGHDATSYYSNLYQRLTLYPGTGIHQHHFMKSRLQRHASGGELELEIIVPDAVKIQPMNPEDATADQVAANNFGVDGENLFTPINLEVEYVLDNPRDAVHFVGIEDGDARYPHAFTRNSPFPGIASCLFPCIDDGATKCIFDVSVRYPRTLGDVFSKARPVANGVLQVDESPKADSVMSDVDDDPAEFSEEEKALEMSVICSGELTDDVGVLQPFKDSAYITRFRILTTPLERRQALPAQSQSSHSILAL